MCSFVTTLTTYRAKIPGKLKGCDHIKTLNRGVETGESQVSTYELKTEETGL
jgi:hypothetical protein